MCWSLGFSFRANAFSLLISMFINIFKLHFVLHWCEIGVILRFIICPLMYNIVLSQTAIQVICKEVKDLVRKCGKVKMLDAIKLPPPELYRHVEV